MRLQANPVLAVAVSLACGQEFTQAQVPVEVSTRPSSVALPPGGTTTFTAQVTGNPDTSVLWSVQEGSPGGSVSDGGVYVAPSGAGTYHVVATSVADITKSGFSVVSVMIGVAVNPGTKALDACTAFTFTATVAGSTNTAVNWSVLEGAAGGTIASNGLYTAPSTPGTYHVVATSQADPTKSASAVVTVSTRIISVTVDPPAVNLLPAGTQTFTATVTNSCGTFTASKMITADDLKKAAARRGATMAGGQ